MNDAEFGADFKYASKKERLDESTVLMEARLERMKNLSPEQILRAKLLQLKLRMEEYIKKPVFTKRNFFTDFLTAYIDIIYSKRSDFASDIDVTPVRLSQVLNGHRAPKDEFMLRLMVHSEKTYQSICEFHKMTWYQVYYYENLRYHFKSR